MGAARTAVATALGADFGRGAVAAGGGGGGGGGGAAATKAIMSGTFGKAAVT
jgi:hypothetical protein